MTKPSLRPRQPQQLLCPPSASARPPLHVWAGGGNAYGPRGRGRLRNERRIDREVAPSGVIAADSTYSGLDRSPSERRVAVSALRRGFGLRDGQRRYVLQAENAHHGRKMHIFGWSLLATVPPYGPDVGRPHPGMGHCAWGRGQKPCVSTSESGCIGCRRVCTIEDDATRVAPPG